CTIVARQYRRHGKAFAGLGTEVFVAGLVGLGRTLPKLFTIAQCQKQTPATDTQLLELCVAHALMATLNGNLFFRISDCWYESCPRGTGLASRAGRQSDGSPYIPKCYSGFLAQSHVRGILRLGASGVAFTQHDDHRAVRARRASRPS